MDLGQRQAAAFADTHPNLRVARAVLRAIEMGDLEALRALFHPDAVQIEYPNRLKAKGDRRDLKQMSADFERGKAILDRQSYVVRRAVADGDAVALEVSWTGVLKIPLGALKPGDEMTAESAIFMTMRDGKIIAQSNYDCFAAF